MLLLLFSCNLKPEKKKKDKDLKIENAGRPPSSGQICNGEADSVLTVGKQAVGSTFYCFLPASKVRSSEHALTLSHEAGGDSPSASSSYCVHFL